MTNAAADIVSVRRSFAAPGGYSAQAEFKPISQFVATEVAPGPRQALVFPLGIRPCALGGHAPLN
jgi:hypothetical protein